MLKINRIDTNLLRSLKPCEDRLENWLLHYAEWSGTVIEFLLLDKITYSDKRWVLFNRVVLDKSDFVELACRLAENVLPVFQRVFPSDKRPRNAIIAARLANTTDPTFYASADAAAAANAAVAAAVDANAAAVDANAAADANANAAAAGAAANAAAAAAASAAIHAASAAAAAYVADVAYDAASAVGAETEQLNIIISYLNEICNVVVNDTQQNNVVNLTQDILGRNVNE